MCLVPALLWLATEAFLVHQQVQLLGEGLFPLVFLALVPIGAWIFEPQRPQCPGKLSEESRMNDVRRPAAGRMLPRVTGQVVVVNQ